jgi:hypothetical protein
MSSNVARIVERLPVTEGAGDVYLGPADLRRIEGHDLHVELPSGAVVRAEPALAFPYEPAEGDVLLVIGKGGAHYVIGVLRGSGRTVLSLPGDARLHVGGALDISAEKGVTVRGPSFEVHTKKLRAVAEMAMETFTTAYRRVSDLLSVHAGKSHTLVDDVSYAQSKSAAIVTEESMTINGSEIHLG